MPTEEPPPTDAPVPRARGRQPTATRICLVCRSRFTSLDARFCPFDGEPLNGAAEAAAADPLLGTVVDERYYVESVLGEGGMGTVYRITHRVLGKALALKVLRSDLSRESELGVRFHREARAAASVGHPNVVQITDFGTLPSGQPYFVMELLAGESLSSLVRKGGPIPAARAVRLLVQMVDALAAAHGAGVIHRDLKPENIFVCNAGQGADTVKVLDFGLARVAGQSRLTKAGLVFGTPHYMSPEQAQGNPVDERTDIYALGIVMYEMFTGSVPFEADTYMGVLTKHLYVAPTPPSVVLGGTRELGALEQVTLRCLEKKAERRYESMAALGAELRSVARFTDGGALELSPARPGERREAHRLADEIELPAAIELELLTRRRRRRAGGGASVSLSIAAGAALVVVIGVLGATWWSGRSPSQVAAPPGVPSAGQGGSSAPPPPDATLSAAGRDLPPVPTPIESAPRVEGAPAERPRAASRRTARKPPAATAESPKRSTAKEKMVGTDIIDPWSR